MNIVILSGRIAKIYDNNNNARIVIADNYKNRTDFITVNLFGNIAAHVVKYMSVGDNVSIEGRVSTYRSSTGGERTSIIGNRVNFEGYRNPKKSTQYNNPTNDFVDIGDTKDIPWQEELNDILD